MRGSASFFRLTPVRITLLIFLINIIAIGSVFAIITPEKPDFVLRNVSIQQVEESSPGLVSSKPVHLQIESANVDIEVVDGAYDPVKVEWDLTRDKAHYALVTPEVNNQVGNTLIYGHNLPGVFASLDDAQKGDIAQVTTEDGSVFSYTLKSIKDVDPTDTSLFEYRGDAILTVQTCSGTWFEKRRLFTFEFTEVQTP